MRIGIDLGGTKIEGVVLDETSQVLARKRVPTPQNDYHATAAAIAELALALETQVGGRQLSIGIGNIGIGNICIGNIGNISISSSSSNTSDNGSLRSNGSNGSIPDLFNLIGLDD